MEQNKILLIVLSVALFLAAILSVGLWFFYPREKEAGVSAAAEAGTSTSFDPIEWVRSREDFPALTQRPPVTGEEVIIVYGEDPAAAKPPVTAPAVQAPVPSAPPAPLPPSPAAVTAPAPKAPAAAVPAPAAARTPAPARTVTVREYSIQVGSFSSRDRAEDAGRVLKEKGLAGQILSRNVNGTQFYRLRIGPYSNKAEAEKFLVWVRGIQGFENSLIFEGYGTRTVPN